MTAHCLLRDRANPSVAVVARLGAYAPDDERREALAIVLADDSTLVLDCMAGTLSDARVIAHLSPDELLENARIVADMYLSDETRGRCRRLSALDPHPFNALLEPAAEVDVGPTEGVCLSGSSDANYAIREVGATRRTREIRWTRSPSHERKGALETVPLRGVVGALEEYEPARTITASAIAASREAGDVSTGRLREEALRLSSSPVVLNRRLREAVERSVASGLTMSEIALRCGRTKRERNGTRSGEATWLARRIGQMAEGGKAAPTPWIHTDTPALIAREGLGLSPNEVEL